MRKKNASLVCLIIPAVFLLLRCRNQPFTPEEGITPDSAGYRYVQPVRTNDGWETGSLGNGGMDTTLIEEMVRDIDRGLYTEIHSILVARDNKLVFEKYWPGHDFSSRDSAYHGTYIEFDMGTRHNTHSATKSIVSAIIGIAVDQGLIKNENHHIFEYLPTKYYHLSNEGRELITIKHCLMMASGLEWNEWDIQTVSSENDMVQFNRSYDPIGYLLSKPLASQPGASFYYNGGTVDLLGAIIDFILPEENIQSFSADHLFNPLGISNYNWVQLYPSRMTCCHGDIHIPPRDMGKIGQLFLDKGVWNGVRVISEEWVDASTQNRIDPNVYWADGYGYLWWRRMLTAGGTAHESFKAIGWGGQEIFVFRDLDMVAVFTGANYMSDPPCDKIMAEYILPAIREK